MEHLFTIASLWLGLAVFSAVIAYHLRISIALIEICVGVAAGAVAASSGKAAVLGSDMEWLRFLASSGAVLLTFLAGAELELEVMRTKLKEVSIVGLVGFLAPFLGCAALARYALGWNPQASLLCGVALSTTSMAVVYAVMVETGFNRTEFGKGILGACFVNDLGTVIVLGLLFSPFTYKTVVFIAATVLVLVLLPHLTGWLTRLYAYRTAAIRTKWVMFILFGLGALALLVRQRIGPPRLCGRHGSCGSRLSGWVLDSAAPNPDRRLSHPLLFPPGRDARLRLIPDFAPRRFLRAPRGQGCLENLRPLSDHPVFQKRPQREVVLYSYDVDRPDFWNHFGPLRFLSRHRDAAPILLPGGGRDRERGRADTDSRACLSP